MAFTLVAATACSALGDDIEIHSPGNNDTRGPGGFTVTGIYNNPTGLCDTIRARVWKVDSSDNPVGDPVSDESENGIVSGTLEPYEFQLVLPAQPNGTTVRYRITIQILDGTDPKDTTTIYVNSVSSG